jgi:hypothetical protein
LLFSFVILLLNHSFAIIFYIAKHLFPKTFICKSSLKHFNRSFE